MGDNAKKPWHCQSFLEKGLGNRLWIEHDPDRDSLCDEPRFRFMLDKPR
jgi:hypothetical protein